MSAERTDPYQIKRYHSSIPSEIISKRVRQDDAADSTGLPGDSPAVPAGAQPGQAPSLQEDSAEGVEEHDGPCQPTTSGGSGSATLLPTVSHQTTAAAAKEWSDFYAGRLQRHNTNRLPNKKIPELGGELTLVEKPAQFARPVVAGVPFTPPFRLRFEVTSPNAFQERVACRALLVEDDKAELWSEESAPKDLCPSLGGSVIYKNLECMSLKGSTRTQFAGSVDFLFTDLVFTESTKLSPVRLVFVATVPGRFNRSVLHKERTISMAHKAEEEEALQKLGLPSSALRLQSLGQRLSGGRQRVEPSSAVLRWGVASLDTQATDTRYIGVRRDDSILTTPLPPGCTFFGLFQGHNGPFAAKLAKLKLVNLVAHNLLRLEMPQDPLKTPEEALTTAFGELEHLAKGNQDLERSGTTLLVALFLGSDLLVANAGTSGAVLCRGDRAEELSETYWHCVRTAHERRGLAIGREDREEIGYLDRLNGTTMGVGPGLEAVPKVSVTRLTAEDSFLLLADQGLWNALTPKKANTKAKGFLADHNGDCKICAQMLMHEARKKGARDVCVMVICLE